MSSIIFVFLIALGLYHLLSPQAFENKSVAREPCIWDFWNTFYSNLNVTFNAAWACGFQLLCMSHTSENGQYSLPHWVQLLLAEGAAPAASSGSRFSAKVPILQSQRGLCWAPPLFATWLCHTGEACLFYWEFLDKLENFRREVNCFQIKYASGYSAILKFGLHSKKR